MCANHSLYQAEPLINLYVIVYRYKRHPTDSDKDRQPFLNLARLKPKSNKSLFSPASALVPLVLIELTVLFFSTTDAIFIAIAPKKIFFLLSP